MKLPRGLFLPGSSRKGSNVRTLLKNIHGLKLVRQL